MTFEEFVEIGKDWLKSGRLLWYVTGNISKENALSLVEKARAAFKLRPTDKEDLVDIRCVSIPSNHYYVYDIPVLDETNQNSCLVSYFEVAPELFDLKTKMLNEVMMQYFDEPFFNQLRTIEQLGYVVFSRVTSYRDILGVGFIVSSAEYSAEYCLNSLHKFLADYAEKIKSVTDDFFK